MPSSARNNGPMKTSAPAIFILVNYEDTFYRTNEGNSFTFSELGNGS